MNGASAALIALLGVVIALAAWRTAVKFRRGGGCCGEREAAVKRVVTKKRGGYDHTLTLDIGGMTCGNCARKVENALNALDGVRAEVRIDTRKARVRCAGEPDEAAMREAVRRAGYVVTGRHG